jgi:tetratricopeptide (TPR) repeat protein
LINYANASTAHLCGRGDFEKGGRLLQEGLDYSIKTGYLFYEVWHRVYLAEMNLFKGSVQEAERQLNEIGDSRSTTFPLIRTTMAGIRGQIHLGELWTYAKQTKENFAFAFALYAEGIFMMDQNEWASAANLLQRSVEMWEKTDWFYERAESLFQLGVALKRNGDDPGATAALNKALEIFSYMEAKLDIEMVLGTKGLLKA